MAPKQFYLTTPLYYVNARPHIGHAYTTIVADTLARWHRQQGEEVFLLTGTDEHGEKIAQAAAKEGVSPSDFADRNSKIFRNLWKTLGISHDHFIRTTDPDHVRIVQQVLERLRPKLTLGTYRFWYCVPCETNWGLSEVDPAKPVCPNCQRPVSQVEEEDYFLPLEEHREWLRRHIQENDRFILPTSRRNEVLGMLEKELPPLCVTRPKERVPWGIEVPFSPTHTTYVWFDALLNYVTALGWPAGKRFHELWQETGAIHLVGKDILRHHALYWPIILHAAGVEPPKTIFAHGWWLVKGEKMSKSKGNIVEPEAVVEAYGLDPFRYFLLREVPFGDDGVFSEEGLVKRINSDLANDLGNLVYRTLAMLEKHAGGKIPQGKMTSQEVEWVAAASSGIEAGLNSFAPDQALKSLWELIARANQLVEVSAPWTLAREGRRQELEIFLYRLVDLVKGVALLLWPFLPASAESIWRQIGFKSPLEKERIPGALQEPIPGAQRIAKEKPLFPKIDL